MDDEMMNTTMASMTTTGERGGPMRSDVLSTPRDVGEVEREAQRLEMTAQYLAETITQVFDRFGIVLDSLDRPTPGDDAMLRAPVNTQLGARLASTAESLEGQLARLHDLLSRCSL